MKEEEVRGVKRGRKSNAERERIRFAAAKAERKKDKYAERRASGEDYFRRWIRSADKVLINSFCLMISLLNDDQKRLCAKSMQEQIKKIQGR